MNIRYWSGCRRRYLPASRPRSWPIEDLAITSCTRSSRTILNSTISFVSVGISRSRPPMAKPARLSTGLVRAGACGAAVTAEDYPVGAVVCVQAKDMKQAWCLATSLCDENARGLLKKYSKRWSIECSFRDTKDPHFGMGMGQIRINSPERRDRLWLLNAL